MQISLRLLHPYHFAIDEEKAKVSGAIAVCISGAGPTMLAISKKEIAKELVGLNAKWQVLDLKVE